MKAKTLRIIIPLVLIAVVAVGFATSGGIGTLAAFGWQDISLLCPLGALSTMLASKLFIPRAVVSLVIAIVVIVLLGRAFCAWVCPVPVVSKLREAFSKKKPSEKQDSGEPSPDKAGGIAPLTAEEAKALSGCKSHGAEKADCGAGCTSCAEKRASVDSRHFVLGGALASAAIFGFPVFCLICPIGLTFATVLLVMRMFAGGDMTWAIIVVPALLLVEVVFFRKWCSSFCPLSALMSLIAKLNKTFKPSIDESTCLESGKGASCGRCAQVCPEGINVRHPELGASWSECTRCRECVDACPAHAISMPLLAKRSAESAPELVAVGETPNENVQSDNSR